MLKKFILGIVLFGLFIYWTQNQGTSHPNAPTGVATQKYPIIAEFSQPNFKIINAYSSLPEFETIDDQVNQFLEQWEIKGASLAIVKDGKLVYSKGFGFADKEKGVEAQPYHQFRIASVSKLFTAVGIMKMVEEGKIKLDDKVFGEKGILPEYKDIADPLAYKIEVEHLLNHTGGWRNELRTDPMFVPVLVAEVMKVKNPITFEQTLQFMLSQKGMFEPGTLYDYSNFGYCLLSKIIEKKSGLTYEKYMQEKILNPIGVNRMRITKNSYKDKHPNEVRYYDHKKAEKNLSIYGTGDSVSRVYEGTNTEALSGAGGWIASSVDLMRFLVAIDGFDTKPDMLKPETIQRMVNATFSVNDTTSVQRSLGWKRIDAEKWWRTGSLESTGISLVRRNDGFSWVFVTNTGSWRGPFFSYEIEGLMRRIMKSVKKWPERDLFELIN